MVVYAGNGKIAGTVKDAANKNPMPGANVTIAGTTLGASADIDGRYYILDVPPGEYDVTASAVGYARVVVKGVRVNSDKTTTQDFELREAAVGLEEVVISAEAPLVDKTRVASKTTLSSDEVTNLPVTTVFDAINTAVGDYNGFVRGGRYVETKTLIDGVDVSDSYSAVDAESRGTEGVINTYIGVVRQYDRNNVSAGLGMDAVEEASLSTGATGAEYTSATAGLINLRLKEGHGPWTVHLFARSSPGGLENAGPAVYLDQSKYFAEKAVASAAQAPKYSWTAGKANDVYNYDASKPGSTKPTTDGEVSLSGGLTDDLGLFFDGRLYNSYGSLPGEFNREADLTLKATYQVDPSIKLTALGLVRDRGLLFGWKNQSFNDAYRYFLEGVPRNNGTAITASLKWTHLLSPSTFYEVQLSDVYTHNEMGYVDGNGDGICSFGESGDFLTFSTSADLSKYLDGTNFFSSGPKNGPSLTVFGQPQYQLAAPGIYYENTKLSNYAARADITSQVTYNHQLKAGVQFQLHDINELQISSPVGVVQESYEVKPFELGFYAQDRIEYAGLILNAGARFDGLAYNEPDFANYFYPAQKDPNPPYGIARAIALRSSSNINMKWYFTPKIGVSHPIENVGSVYFSFSRQMTPQPLANVFAAYNLYGTSPILPGVSAVDQNPFLSTNYELGGQWVFLNNFSLDVNAYFRNIENYGIDAATVVWRSPAGVPNLYSLFFSGGYADARGVEVTLTKRPAKLFDFLDVYGKVSYAYSYVKATSGPIGTTVNPADQTSFSTTAGDSLKYGGQFPFSSYQYYARIEQNVTGVNSTLTGGYDRAHRVTASLFFKFDYDILVSALGKFASGFYYTKLFADPRSRELGTSPWTKQVDVRVEKGFMVGTTRLAAFVDVKNVFNSQNILTYFTAADNSGQQVWELKGDPTGPDKRLTTLDGSPIYDIAREVFLGVTVDF
jgi:hypothetical protein